MPELSGRQRGVQRFWFDILAARFQDDRLDLRLVVGRDLAPMKNREARLEANDGPLRDAAPYPIPASSWSMRSLAWRCLSTLASRSSASDPSPSSNLATETGPSLR